MINATYSIDIFELKEEYSQFVHEICKKYRVNCRATERVFNEAIKTHVLALLNERTHMLFNPISDDWEAGILDILFSNEFSFAQFYNAHSERNLHPDEIVSVIINHDPFLKQLNTTIRTLLKPLLNKVDPLFTIWEVEIYPGAICINAVGDYRIEQWHVDYGVSKSTTQETYTLQLDDLGFYIKKLIDFRNQPAKVRGRHKSEILNSLIQSSVSYFLSDQLQHLDNANILLEYFGYGQSTLIQIQQFFNLEYMPGIEKSSNFSSISHYTVFENSLVIHFNPKVNHNNYRQLSRAEREAMVAENNMDYIPKRQRF